ncbi:MAG: family 78 glycoside hydrolase catalytic domain [Saprospiraceae bacterium]
MSELLKKNIFIFCFIFGIKIQGPAQVHILMPQCEKMTNPAGVPLNGFYFSWQMSSKEKNQVQQAYQIVLSDKKEEAVLGKNTIWNSGKVLSGNSIFVLYPGKKLLPATTYYWRVRVWDKNNKISTWSNVNYFITALGEKNDWTGAKWIGYEELPDSMKVVPGAENPKTVGNKLKDRAVVPIFRKKILIDKKIKEALLYISGLGQYELSINGKKKGDHFLSPGWSYYDKKCFYNIYDVSKDLLPGQNAISMIVGNGFFYINRERYVKMVVGFGLPKMICKIKITYEDGTVKNIVSDETWKTAKSPVLFTSIFGGEDYDAQTEQKDWNKAAFDDGHWKNALLVKGPEGNLIAEQDYPVKIQDSFEGKKILIPQSGKYVYDFGQNCSGIIELKVRGKKGQIVKLTPSELLTNQQLPNQVASGSPYYYTYTLKGDGIETWKPKFTYYGFRYVLVEGAEPDTSTSAEKPKIISLVSLHTRNSSPATGNFQCSNPLYNQINELIRWAIKSNLQSVITDCPHREKLSWLEQDYLMGNSIHYNFNVYHLFKKLVLDMMDAQLSNGMVPDIAPELVVFGGGFRDSPEWGSAAVILPWLIYTLYGDEKIIDLAYPMIQKYVAYLKSKSTGNIVSHGLGDWYDYGPKAPGVAQLTPKALTATAIYYYDVLILQKMAALLQNKEDLRIYQQLGNEIKIDFNLSFYNPETKIYSTGSQTAMAMPLCFGLVDEVDRQKVLQNLIDSVSINNNALTAGDIGFHFLVQALDEGGASQLLYDMNNRNDVAGYGYQLKKGATSLTESWAALEEVSNNHLMLGHIMEWFYNGMAGIGQEKNSIGFNHIKIRPQPVGDLTYAKGSFQSPYGLIVSQWKKEIKKFSLKVTIPVNTDAVIYLPVTDSSILKEGGKIINKKDINFLDRKNNIASVKIGSGNYFFEIE